MFYHCQRAAILVFTIQLTTSAAYISEVFIGGGPQNQPDAVEIAGLAATTGTLELLVLDAKPDDSVQSSRPKSTIQQIIRFDPAGRDVLLLHENPWDAQLYNPQDASIAAESITGSYDFAGARTLVLLSGKTIMDPLGTLSLYGPYDGLHELFLNGAVELDVLTLDFGTPAAQLRSEPIVPLAPGEVTSLAIDPDTLTPGQRLSGTVNSQGLMAGTTDYQVTPGRANLTWIGDALPEPSTLLIAISGLLMLSCRRVSHQ